MRFATSPLIFSRASGGKCPTSSRSCSGLHLVVNRYDAGVEGFAVDDLGRLMRAGELMTVAADGAGLKAASNQGKPLRQVAPRSPALANINRLLSRLLGLQASAAPGAP